MRLFPHQSEALAWMAGIEAAPRVHPSQPLGGILAHAMGLGKTRTVMHHITQRGGGVNLVICPKSVLQNWHAEALLLLPPSAIYTYHGVERSLALAPGSVVGGIRLVLTTFDLVRLEDGRGPLQAQEWARVVVDEAHHLCEAASKTSKAIGALRCTRRWCVTGTPFKNGVQDIAALCKFLRIQPYCRSSWWMSHGRNARAVGAWRRAYMHVRHKSAVRLPPLTEHLLRVNPNPTPPLEEGSLLLEDAAGDADAPAAPEKELLRILRQPQAAGHPSLVSHCHCHCVESPCYCMEKFVHSPKTRAVLELVRARLPAKTAVFSQWTSCLQLLAGMFAGAGIETLRFDGSLTSLEERGAVVAEYSRSERVHVLLASLGAGGEGIDLTCSSAVVLMEPYWNRSVEQQAIDRMHRLGQVRATDVYRLVQRESIEEWVAALAAAKAAEQRFYMEEDAPPLPTPPPPLSALPAPPALPALLGQFISVVA